MTKEQAPRKEPTRVQVTASEIMTAYNADVAVVIVLAPDATGTMKLEVGSAIAGSDETVRLRELGLAQVYTMLAAGMRQSATGVKEDCALEESMADRISYTTSPVPKAKA